MAASLRRCVTFLTLECQRFARDLRIIGTALQNSGNGLALNTATLDHPSLPQAAHERDSKSSSDVLDSVFSNVLLAVQRNRRSLERRMTRRMQMAGHFEYAVPRKDIVADLDSGRWKERGTICRHHYAKVKEETEKMKEELGEAMQYTADQKEVVFLYEGEESEKAKQQGKYVVQMKKERPTWFHKSLLEKKTD
ncbi:hypothetical protein V1264_008331 [Littorina saxatilis]|uniref:Uncharacterized protein n=2 Tax=Littorina saxatilis TaxID=31220 RepID=A0AAN9ASS7_9CAEN